jgi:hypothetical protein
LQLSRQARSGGRIWLPSRATIFEPTMSSPLNTAIAGLCSGEASVWESAAAEIFAAGRASAEHAAASWRSDAELSGLLLGSKPEATVGLAVQRETFSKIRAAHSVSRLAEVPSDQDAEEFELHFANGVSLDILTSRAPGGDGAIARYLVKFGEGVQQVEFRCSNVDRATEILKEKFGVSGIYPETRPGADGTRVNFFLMPVPGGGKVLIELYESTIKAHQK